MKQNKLNFQPISNWKEQLVYIRTCIEDGSHYVNGKDLKLFAHNMIVKSYYDNKVEDLPLAYYIAIVKAKNRSYYKTVKHIFWNITVMLQENDEQDMKILENIMSCLYLPTTEDSVVKK